MLPRRYRELRVVRDAGGRRVCLVEDLQLGRTVALKSAGPAEERGRLLREAWIQGRLAHPGILPVYDQGVLPGGEPYYTMPWRPGLTLDAWWSTRADPWERRLALLEGVARAVAYAHAEGYAHLDLTPANVLVGEHHGVTILDWGRGRALRPALEEADPARDWLGAVPTGSPGWLCPEQVRRGELGAPADVHALGALLHLAATGRAPYPAGPSGLRALLGGKTPEVDYLPLPIRGLLLDALAPAPADRPDAPTFAARLAELTSTAARTAQALQRLAEVDPLPAQIATARAEAERLRAAAALALAPLAADAPEAARWPAWDLADAAQAADAEASALLLAQELAARDALTAAPELEAAHRILADRHAVELVDARARGDTAAGARAAALLCRHDRGAYAALLRGTGHLEVVGLEVVGLARYVERHRMLVAEPEAPAAELPEGSYRLSVRRTDPAARVVHVPVRVFAGQATRVDAAAVPSPGADPEDLLVAGGPFRYGGDPEALDGVPGRVVDVPPFVMRRHPVRNRDYLVFLQQLPRDQAAALAPCDPEGGAAGFVIDGEGCRLGVDRAGRPLDLDAPVVHVNLARVEAWIAWYRARTGLPWRLPHHVEWEKAARGVDGRAWPWGNHFAPGRCGCLPSFAGPPALGSVDAWPRDESPYGVRGLAGNARDWCADAWTPAGWSSDRLDPTVLGEGPLRNIRGGAWLTNAASCRAASRASGRPGERWASVGFRVVRSVSAALDHHDR